MVDDRGGHGILKARHPREFIDEGILRAAQLPQFVADALLLLQGRFVVDHQYLEIRAREITLLIVIRYARRIVLGILGQVPGRRAPAIAVAHQGAANTRDRLGESRVVTFFKETDYVLVQSQSGVGPEAFEHLAILEQAFDLIFEFLVLVAARFGVAQLYGCIFQAVPAVHAVCRHVEKVENRHVACALRLFLGICGCHGFSPF